MKINNNFQFPKTVIKSSKSCDMKDNIMILYKKYLYNIYNFSRNIKGRLESNKNLTLNINNLSHRNTINTSSSIRTSIKKFNENKKKLKIYRNKSGKTFSLDSFKANNLNNLNNHWRYSYKLNKYNLKSNVQINAMSQKHLDTIDISKLKSRINKFAFSSDKINKKQNTLYLVPSLLKSQKSINTIITKNNHKEIKNNKTSSSRKNTKSSTFSNNNFSLYHKLINDMSPKYRLKNFKMQLLHKTSRNDKILLKYDKKLLAEKVLLIDIYKEKENKKNKEKGKSKAKNNNISGLDDSSFKV